MIPVLDIAARLALYAALTLLLGLLSFTLIGARGGEAPRPSRRGWLGFLVVLSLLATVAQLLTQTAAMAGSLAAASDLLTLQLVLTTTATGRMTILRVVLLGLTAAALFVTPRRRPMIGAVLGSAVAAGALATLAWNSHAAMQDSRTGLVHLSADIVHMWAAAIWIGALAALSTSVLRKTDAQTETGARAAFDALARFSVVGPAVVAVLVLTGLVNGAFLVGVGNVLSLATNLYGRLLLLKLALFAAMLGLAAANRYRLTPALGQTLSDAAARGPVLARLRRCLVLETALAALVLVLVAWLGTLAPPVSG